MAALPRVHRPAAKRQSWEVARKQYSRIDVPVLLVYGDRDWLRTAERERTRAAIPNVVTKTINDSGHFLPLDRPKELLDLLVRFVGA